MQNPQRAGVPFFIAAWAPLAALLAMLLASGPAHAWGIVVTLNQPPVIGGTPPASVTAGSAYSFAPSASDPDGDPLTFSIANKPAWASFSSSSGELSGTPGALQVGTYPDVTITVSDGKASATLGPFSITVIAANRPPVIGGTPPGSVIAGFAYSFTPSASDADGDVLTYSIVNRPAWASFSTSTGRLSGTPGVLQVGTYSNITITVSDGKASATLGPFSITVAANRPPVIGGTPPGSVIVGNGYSFTPSASDPDGQRLSFSIANRPVWASFSTSTGRLSGTPGATHVGTYSNVFITASDGRASATLGPFSIVVQPLLRTATVSWTPPTTFVDGTPLTNLAGFRIFYGQSLTALTSSATIPSPDITSAVIEGLSSGTWYFAVKAYTTANVESDLSAVREKTFP